MCGICGAITSNKLEKNMLKMMNDTIAYRGPNDEGYYFDIFDRWNLGFAQRRLSILDLSEDGHQPMLSKDKNIVVTYNGEVYNFKEIKRKLEKLGYSFNSKCDTEVIVYAYAEWGLEFVNELNGMFAIAIYDKLKKEVILVRDRMGVKPLYYYFDENSNFAFASELKPIMKADFFKKEIDLDAVNMFLAHQYIAAPKSIFKNTFKLEPGNILVLKNGEIEIKKYWDPINKFNERRILELPIEKVTDELEKLIIDAVNLRMIADVPVGTFLSGGVDSSLISAIAQASREKPIDTFTIGFNEEKYNEAPFAKKIADIIGSNHHEEYCSIDDMKKLVYDIPKYFDEPFADSSQIPTMLVSKIAKKNVTVALSGDAGDELFCGYNVYDQMLLYKKMYWAGKLIGNRDILNNKGSKLSWRISKLLGCSCDRDATIIDYIKSNDIIKTICTSPPQIMEKYEIEKILKTSNIQEKRMLLDMITYLPDDILTKVDRASMSCGLEARTPLLDYRVIEYSFNIPHVYKSKDGEKKYILKELLSRYIPRETFERPKKGFGVPLERWLNNDLKKLIEKYLNYDYINKQGVFKPEGIRELLGNFEKYSSTVLNNMVWSLLVFQLWYKEYME